MMVHGLKARSRCYDFGYLDDRGLHSRSVLSFCQGGPGISETTRGRYFFLRPFGPPPPLLRGRKYIQIGYSKKNMYRFGKFPRITCTDIASSTYAIIILPGELVIASSVYAVIILPGELVILYVHALLCVCGDHFFRAQV